MIALFVQALLLDLGRLGAPAPAETVAAAYAAACEAGVEAACAAPGAAHAETCTVSPVGGDPVGCLVRAWTVEAEQPDLAAELRGFACDGGVAHACVELAGTVMTAEAPDPERAAALIGSACTHADAEACLYLGAMAELGRGVRRDAAHAVEAYRAACDLGDVRGCAAAGALLAVGGKRLRPDPPEAVGLLARACDAGQGPSCAILADRLERGRRDVEAEPEEITELYHRACDRGVASSCRDLAARYRSGRGAERDAVLADQLLIRACSLGDARACR